MSTFSKKKILFSTYKQQLEKHFVFKKGNDPKRMSKIAKEFFIQKQIELLEWSALSPDFNPIKHLCTILDQKAGAQCLKRKEELKILLQETWTQIDPDTTKMLVELIQNQLADVIKANGGLTQYYDKKSQKLITYFDLKSFVQILI